MGFIRKTPSGSFEARYRDPSGAQRLKTFSRRADASRFLAEVETGRAAGRFSDPKLGKVRFGEWFESWWETTINLRPSTRHRDLLYIRKRILPSFARTPLSSITPFDVRKWVATLDAEGLAPATVKKHYQIFGKIMSSAVDSALIAESPCRAIKLRPIEHMEMRFLTPDELAHLAECIDPRYRALVLTAAYGGLRWGELVALKRARFSPSRAEVEVMETIVELNGKLLPPGPPKTKAGRRSVKLPRSIAGELAEHILRQGVRESELIFQAPKGGPLRKTFRRRFWMPALEAAELEPLRFHDLRHTAVAFWISVGADPKRIAVRAGHSSVAVVLDRYGHLFPQGEEELTARLDALFKTSLVGKLG